MIRILPLTFLLFVIFNLQVSLAQTTFIIESLPDATPTADTIFICGTFNKWVPDDDRYALKRQLNGQLAVTIPAFSDTTEYKFTRGSWTKVETDAANQYTSNRKLVAGQSGKVWVTIDNWLDLGGARKLSYTTFYFFACAFHGVVLCLLLLRIPKKNRGKLRALFVINGVLVLMYVLLVLNETTTFWQRYASFIFQVSMFAWGPLALYFVYTFFQRSTSRLIFYFFPFFLVVFCNTTQIMNIDLLSILSLKFAGAVTGGEFVFVVGATLFNIILVRKMLVEFPALRKFPRSEAGSVASFIFYFFWTAMAAVLLAPINLLLQVRGYHSYFIEHNYGVAILLSFLIFIEAYYLWRYPDIIREGKHVHSSLSQAQKWIQRLDVIMRESKAFRKPDLNVYEFAEMLGMKPHNLSRLINETYQRNFRDFVNAYRIEEFISLAEQKQFKHYTFFALAQEAGFNSKSTFNLAFKKYMNQSPREYFRDKPVSEFPERVNIAH